MIDLNSADADTLVSQLKISPRLARRIIALRPLQSVADLEKVWGIDAETLARLMPLVTVAPTLPSPLPALTTQEAEQAPPAPSLPLARLLTTGEGEQALPSIAQLEPARPTEKWAWKPALLLIAILLLGAYFRFVGLNWDENLHLHPDERFITMVADQIRPVKSLAEYLDTKTSPLNPMKYGSYTYGMLPLFLTRYVAEWVKMIQYDRLVLVGRALSGLFDLAVVVMLYLLGARLYDRRVGLLAAALSAAAVLPIQLSHYLTVDSFSTVFIVAGFYFAVQIISPRHGSRENQGWWLYALFGLMTGLATACKVNALPLFGVIVLAGVMRLAMNGAWRQPAEHAAVLKNVISGWVVAGAVAALTFRIFQPYAFTGPGLFDLQFNQRWLDVMREVTDQVAGKSEWPPNHHWTLRPITYAWTNMVMWGLGWPLGLAAWLGWAWAAWRCWRGDWQRHLLLVAWVAGYFIWQNMQFWRYMRYFLPIYPIIILLAAWALIEVFDRTRNADFKFQISNLKLLISNARVRLLGTLTLAGVLVLSCAYAFAFTRIYTRPHSRVVASRWILANVLGPLNVIVNAPQGSRSYPIAVPPDQPLAPGQPLVASFQPTQSGTVTTITAARARLIGADLRIKLSTDPDGQNTLAEGQLTVMAGDTAAAKTITFQEVNLEGGQAYYLRYTIRNSSPLSAAALTLRSGNDGEPTLPLNQTLTNLPPGVNEGSFKLTPRASLRLDRLVMGNFRMTPLPTRTAMQVKLARDEAGNDVLAAASVTGDFSAGGGRGDARSPLGEAITFSFPPVSVQAGTIYHVIYQVTAGGPLVLASDTMALETSWDDALPLRVDNLDPLGGIYAPLNLELYEVDTPAKREKMLGILEQTNYIVISSNRAYDAMPRLPLRYPLTLKYYQALFGCECSGDAMEDRAYRADPPLKGPLGFELVATFESRPTLGPFSFSDQSADESFTVYDHPKVLIFKKSPDFSLDKARAILESADLTRVLDQAPLAYTVMPTGLRLPPDRLAAQQAGGTWYEMFDPQSILNRNQTLGILAWYLFLFLLGCLIFPLVFLALPGLPDRGYPLARLIALLLIAWVAWMLGSFKILPFTQGVLWLIVAGLAIVSGVLIARRRTDLIAFVRARWRYLLGVEGLFLALFLFDLVVRLGNPDLWHPWLGGEKPMDSAFFNAVLKAVYFPPDNPWFAGNYLNYYYYGHVIGAVLTKLLGIVPSIAYNLILPTWFAMTGVGIFCVAYNLRSEVGRPEGGKSEVGNPQSEISNQQSKISNLKSPYVAGVVAVILMLLLGNLFQVRQLWQYLPAVSAPDKHDLSVWERLDAVISGAGRVLSGQAELPGDKGRWYFGPSRPILHDGPDTPIAEFPFFTFLYADLHPHLLAMPILFAALAWMLNVLLAKPSAGSEPAERSSRWRWLGCIAPWLLAGLVFGVLRPTHTWDFYTMLGLGALVLGWDVWRTRQETSRKTVLMMAGRVALLVGLAVVMYYPFAQWFGTEYSSLELWKGARTPLGDYLTVHGLFLFILGTFLIWESRPWLQARFAAWRARPLKELLDETATWTEIVVIAAVAGLVALWLGKYQVLTLGLPLLIWIGLLLIRKNQPLHKQIALGLLGTGVGLTVVVEMVVLKGDVGRSNTVFRFYTQVWALFSVAASVALVELIPALGQWSRRWRLTWLAALGLLVLAAATYPVIATPMKIRDRWPNIARPPHNLDGMAYMLGDEQPGSSVSSAERPRLAIYDDEGHALNLATDYAGIRFMQDHVRGTPTIVEGHVGEYRWGARYSIYTGLPTVMGWNWHVRQHNSLLPGSLIDKRIEEVNSFYNTPDPQAALAFLRRYRVGYIVVGDLERAHYSARGLAKFDQMAQRGELQVAFRSELDDQAGVVIYAINQEAK